MTSNGFIQIPASLFTHPVVLSAPDIDCKILMYILGEMTYAPCIQNDHGVEIHLEKYQYMNTTRGIARIFNVHHSVVDRMFKRFEKFKILRQEVRHTKSIITVEYIKTYFDQKGKDETGNATRMRQECDKNATEKNKVISEEVNNSHLNQRGDSSDYMHFEPIPLESSLSSQSQKSPLSNKNQKKGFVQWRENFCEDWEKNASSEKKQHPNWPQISEIVQRYQIPEKDILSWLKKYDIEKIIDAIKFTEDRKPEWKIEKTIKLEGNASPKVYVMLCNPQMIKYIQSALDNNWAQEEKNKAINRVRIVQLIKENEMLHIFDITPKDYCRDNDTGNDFQYSRDPDQLYNDMRRILQHKMECLVKELA